MHTHKLRFRHSLLYIYQLRCVTRTPLTPSPIHNKEFVSRRCFYTYSPRRLLLERVEVAHQKSYRIASPSSLSTSLLNRHLPHTTSSRRTAGGNGKRSSGNSGEDLMGKRALGAGRALGEGGFKVGQLVDPPIVKTNFQQSMRSLPSTDAEWFFFREDGEDRSHENSGHRYSCSSMDQTQSPSPSSSTPFCLLCREYIESSSEKRLHIMGNRASHTNHACREVILDSLALLAIRGYPIDHIYEVWSDALYHHEAFFRIKSLVSPKWRVEHRAEVLSQLLLVLKRENVLDLCLAGVFPEQTVNTDVHYYARRRAAFERLEYIGDNAWGSHISSRMMILYPDQQWQYSDRSATFNCFRDACEMNLMLEHMFDVLHLERLHPRYNGAKIGAGKVKADILEALIGELHVSVWGLEPQIYDDSPYVEVNALQGCRMLALIKHCLTEIYDLIILCLSRELSWNALPLAKELAVRHIWKHVTPRIQRHKMVARRAVARPVVECVGLSATSDMKAPQSVEVAPQEASPSPLAQTAQKLNLKSVASISLPALPALFDSPQHYPRHVKHPLRELSLDEIPECTVVEHTGQDAFAFLHQSFERLGLLNDDSFQIFNRVGGREQDGMSAERTGPQWRKYILQLVPYVATATVLSSPSQMMAGEVSGSPLGEDPLGLSLSDVIKEEEEGEEGEVRSAMGDLDLLDDTSGSAFFTIPMPSEGFAEVYFRDPYYNLFSSPLSVTDAHVSHQRKPFRQHGALRLPLVSLVGYGVADNSSGESGPQGALQRALDKACPPLLSMSLIDCEGEGGLAADGKGSGVFSSSLSQRCFGESPCLFARSKYVPADIKPPSAGVVTDKNLYFGQYAFLAYGVSDFMKKEAQLCSNMEDVPEGSRNEGLPGLEFTEGHASAKVDHTVRATLHENNDTELSQSEKTDQSSEGNCVKCIQSEDEDRRFSDMESARAYWIEWAKARRFESNSFF